MRAFYASGSVGAQLAAVTEAMVPAGQEVGLSVSRDVDRMVVGAYVTPGVELVAVLGGRFDAGRLQAAAAAHAVSRTGAAWVALPYAGRTLYTVSNLAVAPLTEHTLVAGTEGGVRHVLERLAAGGPNPHPAREVEGWMLAALAAPGSAFAGAVDVGSIPPAALHGWPLPAVLTGLSRAALVGDFHSPGLNVASTLTYADPQRATAGVDALRQLAAMVNVASALGAAPRVQNLSLAADGPNVACKFGLDEEGMRKSLASVLRLLAPASPALPPPPVYPPRPPG
jgi:hypothetical protein